MGNAKLPILQLLRANPNVLHAAEGTGSEYFSKFCEQIIDEVMSGRSVYFDVQVAYDIFHAKCLADGKSRKAVNLDLGIVKPPALSFPTTRSKGEHNE